MERARKFTYTLQQVRGGGRRGTSPDNRSGAAGSLSAWKFDEIFARDETVRPSLLHLFLLNSRSHPASRGVGLSLSHGVLGRKMFHAHLTSLRLGAMCARSRKQRLAMGAAAERKSW
jgi:hypothetical protein